MADLVRHHKRAAELRAQAKHLLGDRDKVLGALGGVFGEIGSKEIGERVEDDDAHGLGAHQGDQVLGEQLLRWSGPGV